VKTYLPPRLLSAFVIMVKLALRISDDTPDKLVSLGSFSLRFLRVFSVVLLKAVGDIRLPRPDSLIQIICCQLQTSCITQTGGDGSAKPLPCEDVTSTQPEVHNVLHCCDEPRHTTDTHSSSVRMLTVHVYMQSHLSDHESIHRTCRSFVCSVCGATFKTRAVHRKHLLTIHTQPGAHVCHACGRLFNTSFAMKRHSRMHQLQMNSVDITANTATFCLQPPQPTAAQMDSLQSVNDGGSSSM